MENTTIEKQPTKIPLWKSTLKLIIGIFCALALIGAVMELFMFLSLGTKPATETMIMGAVALFALWKLKLITYKK